MHELSGNYFNFPPYLEKFCIFFSLENNLFTYIYHIPTTEPNI